MIQYIKFDQNSSFGSRDSVLVKIWHSKCLCNLENEVKVTKILSFLSDVQTLFLCKFGQNPPIGSGDLIISSPCQNGVSMQVWSNPSIGSEDKSPDKAHFYSVYSAVTLKMRTRSPKSNRIFKSSQCYNIWSLARIRHLVQEIGCRQVFFGQNLKILQSL